MSCQIMAELLADHALRLALTTAGARARLLADGGAAEVIARFERSVYLRDPDGHLACLGGDGLGLGPLNALVATADFAAARLSLGDRVALDASAATIWRPARIAIPAGAVPAAADLRASLAAFDTAVGHVAPRGLLDAASADSVTRRGRDGLAALGAWIRHPITALPEPVAALIGLGPGLTPAGDDALGGAMIALRGFGDAATADRLAAEILPRAREATSAISFAHLEAAAEGEGAAALHDTLAALARADVPALIEGLQRLDRIGHSSGWDALAGAAAALRALVPASHRAG
jgi:hypothetical protein